MANGKFKDFVAAVVIPTAAAEETTESNSSRPREGGRWECNPGQYGPDAI